MRNSIYPIFLLCWLLSLMNVDAQNQNKITLQTTASIGSKIELKIVADKNAYEVAGAESSTYAGSERTSYKVTSQTITITGDVKRLDCNNNPIVSIDASHCTTLTSLMASKCQLKSVSLATSSKLSMLSLNDNSLESFKLESCPELKSLYIQNNKLSSLVITGASTKLSTLMTYGNALKGSAMKEFLESLPDRNSTYSGSLYGIDTKLASENNSITKDDVAFATAKGWEMWDLNGGNSIKYEGSAPENDIATITLETERPIGEKIELVILSTDNEPIQIEGATGDYESGKPSQYVINASKITFKGQIEEFNCRINSKIKSLTFLQAKHLKKITCQENLLETLDLQGCEALEELSVAKNRLREISLREGNVLKSITCNENKLQSLDLSGQGGLTSAIVGGNPLTHIDLSGCHALRELVASNCQLTSLNLQDCPVLYRLIVYCNRVKSAGMEELVASLNETPLTDRDKVFYALDKKRPEEVNSITKELVQQAVKKGWKVFDYNYFNPQPYEGDEEDCVEINAYSSNSQKISVEATGENIHFEGAEVILQEGSRYTIQPSALPIKILGSLKTLKVKDSSLKEVSLRARDLEILDLANNRLTRVNIQELPDIRTMHLHNNELSELTLPRLTHLQTLSIYRNKLTNKTIQGIFSQLNDRKEQTRGEVYAIDTKDPNESNVVTSLTVKIATDKNWAVYDYKAGSSEVYPGSQPRLGDGRISCTTTLPTGSKIQVDLAVEGALEIEGLRGELSDAGLSTFEVTNPTITFKGDLKKLYLQSAEITTFTHSHCTMLEELSLVKNKLTEISLDGLPALRYLSLYGNALTRLDLSTATSLEDAYAFGNNLYEIKLGANKNLKKLWLNDNKIKTFEAINLPALKECSIENNSLASAKVSRCPQLEQLRLARNAIKDLRIEEVPALRQCYLHSNELSFATTKELAETLPTLDSDGGVITVINNRDAKEKNQVGQNAVSTLKSKNWRVYDYSDGNLEPYIGTSSERVVKAQLRIAWVSDSELMLQIPEDLIESTLYLYSVSGECIQVEPITSTQQKLSLPQGMNTLLILKIGAYTIPLIR